jgi:hypothetical protein
MKADAKINYLFILTFIAGLITGALLFGCTKAPIEKDATTNDVTISLDYKLSPKSDYMSTKGVIGDEYQAFYTKYIAGRILTPARYQLNFTGVDHHFSGQFVGKWKDKDLITLPADTYIISGKSYPKVFRASGDTCYLAIQDTIVIDETTTNLTLKATYDCYLILFDNSNISVYSITESPMSDDPLINGEHNPRMMKTENFYHIFCVANNITVNLETNDQETTRYIFADYKFDIGKYYYFEYINGSYNLQPMNSN